MKKILFIISLLFLIVFTCLYPEIAIQSSKQGIMIWFNQILPSLLPFSVLSGILLHSSLLETLGKNANVFAIIFTLICGFAFGFPIGAKLAADFYSKKLLTTKQAIVLSITANNFSITYVCGYVLPTLFPAKDYKTITYIVLYLLPLIVGTLALLTLTLKKEKPQDAPLQKKSASRFHLDMQIIDAGIISGFESLIKICGYIVMFSLISQMVCIFVPASTTALVILLGNLEITNGIQLLNNHVTSSKYIIAIQLLSFGGLSGVAQTASIFKSSELSIKHYVIGKVLLSALSVLLLFICFNIYH